MNFIQRLLPFVTIAVLALSTQGTAAADELENLRAENAGLKARIATLQAQCSAIPSNTVAPAANSKESLATPPNPGEPPAVPAPSVVPPPGYRLVPEPAPNSETGCSKGLFDFGADAPWKHADNWSALRRGADAAEVEQLLGTGHFNVEARGRVMWQYGKCGANAQGFVVFENGKLLFWQQPDF